MKERLMELRKALKLSRAAFGEKMGVSGDVINNLERGRVELKDPMFTLIVKTFDVSAAWLRDGVGEMFDRNMTALDELAEEYELSDADRILVERFLRLSKSQRDVVTEYIRDVAEVLQNRETEELTTEAAEAAYREALGIAPSISSSASSISAGIRTTEESAGEVG